MKSSPPITALRAERLLRGLSQQKLADGVGTYQMKISRLERGVGKVSTGLTKRIASALAVPVERIFQVGGDR